MKDELTEFDIFQALDRTSILINMVSETLGYVGIQEEEDEWLDDVLPAVKKHYKLLENVQENLMELYQQLGNDLATYEKEKTNEENTKYHANRNDVNHGRLWTKGQ